MYFVFFNDTATTEIYTLSLHDALPICPGRGDDRPRRDVPRRALRGGAARPAARRTRAHRGGRLRRRGHRGRREDRKSTRLNSSHANISYAVFCLKKNNKCCIVTSTNHA